MTEAEWLSCRDPLLMLRLVNAQPNARRTLLLTCACIRRVLPALGDDARHWLAVAEAVAAGAADARTLPDERGESALSVIADAGAGQAVMDIFLCGWQLEAGALEQGDAAWAAERQAQADLVRDIFGDRARAVPFDPVWRTAAVLTLAEAIDADGRYADLPVLGDALEEAGCTRAEVLAHCRQPGLHVRGCWALDLALGRANVRGGNA